MNLSRRSLLLGAGAVLATPGIVRAASLDYVPRAVPTLADLGWQQINWGQPYKLFAFVGMPDGSRSLQVVDSSAVIDRTGVIPSARLAA